MDCYNDRSSLFNALDSEGDFDLIFLDVDLGNENGIDIARELRREQRKSDIVFITSFSDYAVDSYDVEPLHYLLKSGNSSRLEDALNRFLAKNRPTKVRVKTTKGMIFIDLSNIMYFEIFSHDIVMHMKDGREEAFRGTLKNIEEALPPMSFVKPYRSYLVNLECISGISPHDIILNNDVRLPLSKSMYNKIQIIFMDYLGKKKMFL